MAPEHWETDVGDDGVAHLDIPADAARDRVFEVSIDFAVRAAPDTDGAWHALKVLVDGAQAWSRRVPTHPGPGDSLDHRVRCRVPVGQPLRISAVTEVHRARRVRLRVTADEG